MRKKRTSIRNPVKDRRGVGIKGGDKDAEVAQKRTEGKQENEQGFWFRVPSQSLSQSCPCN